MKKVYIYSDGCTRRALDAKKVHTYLHTNNYEIVTEAGEADTVIFFTCAFVEEMAEKSLDKVKELQKYNAELIIAGCLPGIYKEKLAEIFDGRTITTKDLDKIDFLFPENKTKFSIIDDENVPFENVGANTEKTFEEQVNEEDAKIWQYKQSPFYKRLLLKPYHINVSSGCLNNCSYCAIKKAIGPLHSKPIDQCLSEFRNGLNAGYKDFLICADDTGCYGIDIGKSLPDLLDEFTKTEEEYAIGVQSLNPSWLVKYINDIEEILKRGKINFILSSFQSGNGRVLRLMNRLPDIEKIKDAYVRLKKAHPDISLMTGIIIGFPTETKEEFKETLSFIKEVNFDCGFISPFSCIPGTGAERIEPRVPLEEILERVEHAKKFLRNAEYEVTNKYGFYSLVFDKRVFRR